MKLVVQVPCLNEEVTLPVVLGTIPRQIDGIDSIEIVVIDDGSTDRTVEVAAALRRPRHPAHPHDGAGPFVPRRRRLRPRPAVPTSWSTPTATTSTRRSRSPIWSDPILDGAADVVISDRQTDKIEHFSPFKKRMQRFGSGVVNKAARTELPDAASGFRAYSRASLYPAECRHPVQLLHGDDHPGGQSPAERSSASRSRRTRRPANRGCSRTSGTTCSSRGWRSPAAT